MRRYSVSSSFSARSYYSEGGKTSIPEHAGTAGAAAAAPAATVRYSVSSSTSAGTMQDFSAGHESVCAQKPEKLPGRTQTYRQSRPYAIACRRAFLGPVLLERPYNHLLPCPPSRRACRSLSEVSAKSARSQREARAKPARSPREASAEPARSQREACTKPAQSRRKAGARRGRVREV